MKATIFTSKMIRHPTQFTDTMEIQARGWFTFILSVTGRSLRREKKEPLKKAQDVSRISVSKVMRYPVISIKEWKSKIEIILLTGKVQVKYILIYETLQH